MGVRRFVFMAVFLAMAAPASAARLRNPGFETGDFTFWQFHGEGWRPSTFSRDSRRGIYGAVNDVWTNGVDEFRVIHQEMKVKPGKAYWAGVWLRAVCIEGTESFLEVQFMDRDGNVLQQFQSEHVTKDQDHTFMTIDRMVAPEGSRSASVRGVVHLVTQPVHDTDFHVFDNFELREITGPSSGPPE